MLTVCIHLIYRFYAIAIIAVFTFIFGNVPVIQASTYCVNTSEELQTALSEAGSNGENDIIQVVQGFYETFGYMFQYYTDENFDLQMLGGYNTACQTRVLDPSNTVLDGRKENRVIRLLPDNNTSGALHFQGFTVQNGQAVRYESGGGLYIAGSADHSGNVIVDHNIFVNNHTEYFGGGLAGGSDTGVTRIEDNLFVNNSADIAHGGASLTCNGPAYVGNNTVSDNTAPEEGGLRLGGKGPSTMSNNIFYGNTGGDLILSSSGIILINNNIDSQKGAADPLSSGNMKAAPTFVRDGSYRLKSDSTLIDAGNNATAGKLTGTDLDGYNRIFNNTVDIGAYEYTVTAFPTYGQVFPYTAATAPQRKTDPASAGPIGVGTIATGGSIINLAVGMGPFSKAVDIYFGLNAPSIAPDIFILKKNNAFQAISEGLVPWREDVSEDIQETLFGDISSSLLPTGTYTLYLLVSPTGTLVPYYLWSTTFIVR